MTGIALNSTHVIKEQVGGLGASYSRIDCRLWRLNPEPFVLEPNILLDHSCSKALDVFLNCLVLESERTVATFLSTIKRLSASFDQPCVLIPISNLHSMVCGPTSRANKSIGR